MKHYVCPRVLAMDCKLNFDSQSHSLIPTGRVLPYPMHETSSMATIRDII